MVICLKVGEGRQSSGGGICGPGNARNVVSLVGYKRHGAECQQADLVSINPGYLTPPDLKRRLLGDR